MTMHDDPDLQLLERDLRSLARPTAGDERLRRAIRDQLADTWRPAPSSRRLSRRHAIGLAAATAAAATALVALVGSAGSGGPSAADAAIIHRALRAVTPPANAILHVEVVGVQNGVPVQAETWQQTSAPFASRGIKGSVGHQGEFGDDGATSFQYDPTTNTIQRQPDSSRPTFTDPISQVRQEIASGHAQVHGTTTIGGRALYEIDLPHGLVGYFQMDNYRPRYLDDPQRDGSTVRLRVVAYEYLPMTATNRRLLSVTAEHPDARIIAAPTGAASK